VSGTAVVWAGYSIASTVDFTCQQARVSEPHRSIPGDAAGSATLLDTPQPSSVNIAGSIKTVTQLLIIRLTELHHPGLS
jgi:hypothetical protein